MLSKRLLRLWSWLVGRGWCPCALGWPEWAMRLCGDIDYYAWKSGFWGSGDA